jgi:hypothetical protein
MIHDLYTEENIGLDVSKVCDKHNIGRHDLIVIATRVARLGEFTPLEALEKLAVVDNIDDYLVSLEFNKETKDL